MAAIVASNIVTDGLVAYWDAGNRASYPGTGNAWAGLASGNNATLYDDASFDSDNLGYIAFDGTDDYAGVPASASINITDKITIGIWVQFTRAIGGLNDEAIVKGRSSEAQYSIHRHGNDGNFRVALWTGAWTVIGDSPDSGSAFVLTSDVWWYLTGTYDRTEVSLYVDGVWKNSTNETDAITGDASHGLAMGGIYWSGSISGNAMTNVALAQIYNRALTAAEVLQNYNATKGRFT